MDSTSSGCLSNRTRFSFFSFCLFYSLLLSFSFRSLTATRSICDELHALRRKPGTYRNKFRQSNTANRTRAGAHFPRRNNNKTVRTRSAAELFRFANATLDVNDNSEHSATNVRTGSNYSLLYILNYSFKTFDFRRSMASESRTYTRSAI